MNVPETIGTGNTFQSLEAMEFEFAIAAQAIRDHGFENCVTAAANETGAKVLFQMPFCFMENCQRVAAVLCGNGAEQRVVLVLLCADGCSIRVENGDTGNPIFRLANSYAELLSLADIR
jgi:hypothetical protein